MNTTKTERIGGFDLSQDIAARVAGLLYLIVIVAGIFAHLIVRASIIVAGDATETAKNIMDNELLFRLGFVVDIIAMVSWFLLGYALYVLLKPVSKNLAVLMVLSFSAGIPIMLLNLLNHFAAILLLSGDGYMTAFTTAQLNAQALFYLDLHHYGYIIAAVFTSFCLLPLGYLILKSDYFPKVLGLLFVVGASLGLVDHLGVFLFESMEDLTLYVTLPLTIAEFSFCGWLLVKGAKVPG